MTVKITKPEFNIREKINELHKPSGIAGEAMLRAETPQEQFNLINAGRKNLFINGAFEIFQRGAGPASPSSGNSPSTADRWNIPNTSEVSEVVANDRASHLSKMLKVTANSSGYGQVAQWIENVRTAAGQNVTVSCWVKSPTAGPMRFHIYQNFGSGGSSTVSVIDDASYFTINKADVWQRFEATIYIPSVDGKTIGDNSYLAIQMGAPSSVANRIVYYSEMQAELGKVATPFEHRSFGEELALCQRYYTVLAAGADYDEAYSGGSSHVIGTMHKWNTTNTFIFTDLPTQMRNSNDMTLVKSGGASDFSFKSAGYTSTGNDLALDGDSSSRSIRINSAVTNNSWPNGCSGWVRCNTNSAFVAIDCEL